MDFIEHTSYTYNTIEMDIHSLSVPELKKLAQERKIKQYYIKKRVELIELLLKDELPFEYIVEKMTIRELRQRAKEKGVPKLYSLSRGQLVEVLFPELYRTSEKKNQYDKGTEKHDDPENSNSK